MAFRTFIDSAGQEWQVYEVVPLPHERRRYDRRSSGAGAPAPVSEPASEPVSEPVRDRRDDDDRRLTVGRQSPLVAVRQGWLTFERGQDRRRLSPIPDGWATATDAELERYRGGAREVRPRISVTPPAPAGPPVTNEPQS